MRKLLALPLLAALLLGVALIGFEATQPGAAKGPPSSSPEGLNSSAAFGGDASSEATHSTRVESPEGQTRILVEVFSVQGAVSAARVTLGQKGPARSTDAQGMAVFDGVPSGALELLVEAGGFRTRRVPLRVTKGEETRTRIWLQANRTLRGFVALPEGSPAAGAKITNRGSGEAIADPSGRFEIKAQLGDVLAVDEPRGRASVRITERLWASGFVVLRLSPPPASKSTARIAGTVIDDADGSPLPDVVIQLREGHGAPFSTVSDASGRFELRVPQTGRFNLRARAPDNRLVVESGVVAGREDLVLRMIAARGAIEGLVVDASGRPTPAFVLRWAKLGGSAAERSVFAEDGGFRVENLEAGEYRVEAETGAGRALARGVQVPTVGQAFVELRLESPGRVEGIVLDGDGRGLAEAVVRLESRPGLGRTPATQGEPDGHFVLDGIAPGRRSLSAWVRGYRRRIVSGLDVLSGETVGPIEIVLSPAKAGGPELELVGIGASLQPEPGGLAVRQVIEGGGAAEAGLAPGSRITAIDGRSVDELGFDGAIQAIRGREGTTVQLTLDVDGETQLLTLSRRRIST